MASIAARARGVTTEALAALDAVSIPVAFHVIHR
jgi:hypothetical protein